METKTTYEAPLVDFKQKLIDETEYYEKRVIKLRERMDEINNDMRTAGKLGFSEQQTASAKVFTLIAEEHASLKDLTGTIRKYLDSLDNK